MRDSDSLLEVGYIAKAHGLRGEVIVALTTDRTERVEPDSVLTTDAGELTVLRSQPHQKRWIVAFDGVHGREAAEALRGTTLYAEPLDDDDVIFVHELVGRPVVTGDGAEIGTCVAVVDNPAHDLLELDTGHLVPVVFVIETTDDHVVVELPEGLLDL